jgi:hypothetical protein
MGAKNELYSHLTYQPEAVDQRQMDRYVDLHDQVDRRDKIGVAAGCTKQKHLKGRSIRRVTH